MKNLAFYTGLILIILGFSSGILFGAYLFFIAITIFIIGAILILISKIKFIHKVLFIIIPLLLYFPVNKKKIELTMYLQRKEFILPPNFSGPIRIFYGEKCGEKVNTVDKTYVIPKDGILILSEDDFYPLNYQFFIIKQNEKIRIYETEGYIENKPFPCVIFMKSEGDTKKGFHDYYIFLGEKKMKYDLFGENKEFVSLANSRIKDCREK